ncbi:FAD:protein FMN transferase [Dokdonella sp. MW10]|uniref:FAD:protein FMN transferase n=1 Tax=Dokdonella sp. MW10 TaxID=2992926 RepID=UPI003F7EEEDF
MTAFRFLLAFAVLACAGCGSPRLQVLEGETMGTTWSVKLAARDDADSTLRAGIQAELDEVVAQMSTWEADADLTRFNRSPAGTWFAFPAEAKQVLDAAFALARDSGGAYDPTVGPLVSLWGFGPDGERHEAPSVEQIAAARARVGWQRVAFGDDGRVLQPGDTMIDLSSIAKGFGVDEVARHLDRAGVADYLVEVGGELRAKGRRPDGTDWHVAVQRPVENDRTDGVDAQHVLALRDLSLATSGDYRHFFEQRGRRYSHTIDPRTAEPVAHALASVTVVHADCMQADALATALTVLGPDEGWDYAQRHGLAVLFITRHGEGFEERMTPAFEKVVAR